MGDLTSRKAVIDIIHKEMARTSSYLEHETQINIETEVYELPTAYDVEKVEEKLEVLLDLARASLKSEIEMSGECTTFIQERYRGHIEMLETAIDIVKQGGAE